MWTRPSGGRSVSLSADSAAQLGIYAQMAIGFAGFAGVIGAFSRFRMHAEATAFRVRAMVALALMEAVFSLLPSLVAGFGLPAESAWRTSGGLLAVCSTGAMLIMARQARILYRVGHLMRTAAYVLCAVAVIVIAPLAAAVLGVWTRLVEPLYFTVLFFGMVVCAYHFILLMVAVRLDDQEEVKIETSPARPRPRRKPAAG